MLEKISSIYTNPQTKVYVSVAVKMLLKEIFPQLLKLLLRCSRICWRFCLDLTFFIVLRLKCDIIFLLQQRTNFLCIVVRIVSPSKKKDYWVNVQLCKTDNLNILQTKQTIGSVNTLFQTSIFVHKFNFEKSKTIFQFWGRKSIMSKNKVFMSKLNYWTKIRLLERCVNRVFFKVGGGKSSFKNAGRFHRRDINLIALLVKYSLFSLRMLTGKSSVKHSLKLFKLYLSASKG